MILEIFKDSLEYSYKDSKSIFILGVLIVLSVFIFPIFFVYGFLYRVTHIGINGTINGDDPLPNFENLGRMIVEGIKIMLVRFIYFLPGTILFLVFFSMMISLTLIESTNIGSFQVLSFLLFTFGITAVSIIIWAVSYLFSTVAIPNVIYNNSFLKAFDFKEIIGVIKSIGFFRYVKFYLGCIILFIGIVGTVSVIMSLFIGSITFLTGLLQNMGITIFGVVVVALLSSLALLFLTSFFLIFESRAIALIYNMREID